MTKTALVNRITRIKGLKLMDPWGTPCTVGWLADDAVWVYYDGLDGVPFARGLEAMLSAANGLFLADKSDQFDKTLVLPSGMTVVLSFEPYWSVDNGRVLGAVVRPKR